MKVSSQSETTLHKAAQSLADISSLNAVPGVGVHESMGKLLPDSAVWLGDMTKSTYKFILGTELE